MLNRGAVTNASAAIMERISFAMRALDAYRHRTTRLEAFSRCLGCPR
jgi:hypothetical protein